MKLRIAPVLALLAGLSASLSAQKIAATSYTTADGLPVRMEKTWAGAAVSQDFSESDSPAAGSRALFKISWSSGIKAASQEIRLKNAKGTLVEKLPPDRPSKALPAGKYSAEAVINFGEWGVVKFELSGLELKPAPQVKPAARAGKKPSARSSTTTVSLAFNLPLVKFSRKPAALKGLARYEAVTWWAPAKLESSGYIGRAWLLPPGVKDLNKRSKLIDSAERWGTIKPGGYDLLISVDLGRAGRSYDVRIPGAKVPANQDHRVDLVLNGSSIRVTGETVPKAVRFYPAGTAAARREPDRKQELFGIEEPGAKSVCPPGYFDILYDYGQSGRNEWRPGVRLEVGAFIELDSAPAPAKIVSFDQGSPGTDPQQRAPGDAYFGSADELLAAYSRPNRFDGDFAVARLLAPYAAGGSYEVERLSDGEKMRTPFVIAKSRPAKAAELKPEMLVIYRVMDEYGRRGNDRWLMGLVKDASAKGEVVLLRHNHDAKPSLETVKIELIRIIEAPLFKFKIEGTNYIRVR